VQELRQAMPLQGSGETMNKLGLTAAGEDEEMLRERAVEALHDVIISGGRERMTCISKALAELVEYLKVKLPAEWKPQEIAAKAWNPPRAQVEQETADAIADWLDGRGISYGQRSEVAGSSTERLLRDAATALRCGVWRDQKKGG
jgi:hypothetical protein